MKIYKRTDSHLYHCGYWNGSPLEIAMTPSIKAIPKGETEHWHDYHEYYCILEGRGKIDVNGQRIEANADSVIMIEPGEKHQISWVDPDVGMRWVLIKQKSEPNSKKTH